MAAKAALAFLLLATAAAYSSQRVPIDARRSHVVAAERRRRFNAAAALIGVAAVPSTARAITWKVRDRRPLHSDESRRWRGGGSDSTRRILDCPSMPSTRRRHPRAGQSRRRQRRVHGQVPESHSTRVWNCARNPRLGQGRRRATRWKSFARRGTKHLYKRRKECWPSLCRPIAAYGLVHFRSFQLIRRGKQGA